MIAPAPTARPAERGGQKAVMTLEQLRIFIAVAEHQHVTRAAKALNLAQSAASAAVAALESRHGTRLFNRVGRGIELTEAGRVFLGEARAVLARAEAAELALAELGGLKRGTLSVYASQTIADYWLPRHLVAFRRAFPGIDIRMGIGNTADAARAVLEGAAELGFVEGPVHDPALTSRTVARDQLELVVGPDHDWVGIERLDPRDLTRTDWVIREPGSGTRSAFEAALESFGLELRQLKVVLELPSNESVRAAVEAGMGASVISGSVVAPSIESGLLHRVRLNLPDREFHVLHHRERYQTLAVGALLKLIGGGDKRSRSG
jgi:DNA-binding transcriptional LysR family regulator